MPTSSFRLHRGIYTMSVVVLAVLQVARIGCGTEHPGNVFLAGEEVRVAVPASWSTWRAIDIDGKDIAHGNVSDGAAAAG